MKIQESWWTYLIQAQRPENQNWWYKFHSERRRPIFQLRSSQRLNSPLLLFFLLLRPPENWMRLTYTGEDHLLYSIYRFKGESHQKHSPRYTQNNGCPMFQSSWLKKNNNHHHRTGDSSEAKAKSKGPAWWTSCQPLLSWRNTRHQYKGKPPSSKLHWRASLVTRHKESACQCRRHRFNPRPRKIPYSVEQLNPRMNHKLESRFLGEIETTSDMQMIPL